MKNKNMLPSIWLVLAVLGRLIPHPPNFNPLTSMALFGGAKISRKMNYAITLGALLISDIVIAKLEGHAVFGFWSLFTYSGFAAIVFAGSKLAKRFSEGRTLGFLVGSSLFFWLWTNFGVWLGEGMYPHTLAGLTACYAAAIPFLHNSMLGDLVWGLTLFLTYAFVEKRTLARA
jgi:hypothetical protein